MQLGDLLQWLSLGQKTGTLVIAGRTATKKIFFKSGRILSSASNDPREYLGQFLMSHGYITENELSTAIEVQQRSKILLGKILVIINAISEEDLIRIMRLKAEESIYDVFLWSEGDFEFIDDELPEMELIPLQVDVTGLILEGSRRVDEWHRIQEIFPTTDLVPSLTTEIIYDSMTDVQRIIAQLIDGQRDIARIIEESHATHFQVTHTLFLLDEEHLIQLVALTPPEPEETPVEAPFDMTPIELSVEDEVVALLARAQSTLRSGGYERALRLIKAAQDLDPDNLAVRNAAKGAETVISAALKRDGIQESKIPKIAMPFEEITTMNFNPNEGFVLSRINGMWDLGSIMKISPMREIDALLIFHKLYRDGVITFDIGR